MNCNTTLSMEELMNILHLIHDIEYPEEWLDKMIRADNRKYYMNLAKSSNESEIKAVGMQSTS